MLRSSRARCPRGHVRLSRRLGLKLLEWHSGQTSPVYAVGSSAYAGQCVDSNLVRLAMYELRRTMREDCSDAACRNLRRLVIALENCVKRCECEG